MIYCQEKCGSSWVFPVWHPLSFKQWGIWAFSVAATLLARWGKMRSHFWGNKKGWWWIQRASKTFEHFHIFFLLVSFRSVPFQGKGQHRPRLCNNSSSNNSNKKREGHKNPTTAATITRRNHPFSAQLSHSPVKTHGRRGTQLTNGDPLEFIMSVIW